MKNFFKIISSYLFSTVGVTVLLVILNFSFLIILLVNTSKNVEKNYRISEVSDGLTPHSSGYELSPYAEEALQEQYEWAVLLNNQGDILWSKNTPDDFPQHYSISDIASLTHWYFHDYPVFVWRRDDGLLILGSPQDSLWKMQLELPLSFLDYLIAWIPVIFLMNIIVTVFLALLMGFRLFRSVKQIIQGIDNLSQQKPVHLQSKGILSNLANKLNQASNQLQKQQSALQKRDNARTTWIAGVSHDIRTPLSMVLGYASQLEENENLPGEERKQAAIIRQQSENIKKLISNLNLASKLEYGMQAIQMELIFPTVVLREIISAYYNQGLDEKYAINLVIEPHAEYTSIMADAALFRRAINNLLENSIKHNQQGTIIQVSASIVPPDYRISIADHGTAIGQDVISSVNSNDTPENLPQHGLGLILVRQILQAHGGRMFFNETFGFINDIQLNFPLK